MKKGQKFLVGTATLLFLGLGAARGDAAIAPQIPLNLERIVKNEIVFDVDGDGVYDSRFFWNDNYGIVGKVDLDDDNLSENYVLLRKSISGYVLDFWNYDLKFYYSDDFDLLKARQGSMVHGVVNYDFIIKGYSFEDGIFPDENALDMLDDSLEVLESLGNSIISPFK